VKLRISLLAGFLLLGAFPAGAQAQVAACTKRMAAIGDGKLQAAADALRTKFPTLELQSDDACARMKSTTRALTATLGRNLPRSVTGFEYVRVIEGEAYFTLERFRLGKADQRKRLDAALQKCGHCKLKIPENTCHAHFVAGDSVVLLIAGATGCKTSMDKLPLIEQAFAGAVPAPASTPTVPPATTPTEARP
jgi:hypothetical protein